MDIGTTAAVVGTGTAVIVALIPVVKLLRRLSRQMGQLQEDWYGESARPGFPAVPGIPERLQRIEAQVTSNGGSSMRDAISRVELAQSRQAIDMGIVARRLDDHLREVGPAFAELATLRRTQNATTPAGDAQPIKE